MAVSDYILSTFFFSLKSPKHERDNAAMDSTCSVGFHCDAETCNYHS